MFYSRGHSEPAADRASKRVFFFREDELFWRGPGAKLRALSYGAGYVSHRAYVYLGVSCFWNVAQCSTCAFDRPGRSSGLAKACTNTSVPRACVQNKPSRRMQARVTPPTLTLGRSQRTISFHEHCFGTHGETTRIYPALREGTHKKKLTIFFLPYEAARHIDHMTRAWQRHLSFFLFLFSSTGLFNRASSYPLPPEFRFFFSIFFFTFWFRCILRPTWNFFIGLSVPIFLTKVSFFGVGG